MEVEAGDVGGERCSKSGRSNQIVGTEIAELGKPPCQQRRCRLRLAYMKPREHRVALKPTPAWKWPTGYLHEQRDRSSS